MLKALEKNRDARFATMHEFARALDKVMPSDAGEERVLGELVRSLLLPRALKRNKEVREALRSLGHTKRPVNLSQIYDEEPPSRTSIPTAIPQPAAAPAPAPKVAAAPAAALALPRASNDPVALPPGLADQRSRVKLIVAGVAFALAVVIALWAVLGDSGSSGPNDGSTPTKKAF
jgi:hypothetical protein